MVPDKRVEAPGIMLFCHGCGPNRFQNQPMMEHVCNRYNLVCISPEYRQSGYAFDMISGKGYSRPYDISFYQVFDVLNALRFYIDTFRNINRKRIYIMGQSQGGHIALLCSIFAPRTFSFVNAYCSSTNMDEKMLALSGRDLSVRELSVRSVIEHVDEILCPVYIVHGTADKIVDCNTHTKALVRLRICLKKIY